jgi:hypothetical protein
MLGMSSGLHHSIVSDSFSPEQISSLVGWWDFTDLSNMFTDAGTTNVTANDDKIYRVNNKAYSLITQRDNALGQYLQQTTEGSRPKFDSSISGATFDGTDDYLTALRGGDPPDAGGISTNRVTDTVLNGQMFTAFYVVKLPGTSVSSDEYLFHVNDDSAQDRMSIYIKNATDDRWQFHLQNNTTRTNSIINSGIDLTTNKEIWTVDLDGASSGSLYRNGDTSAGVTNGDTDNHNINLNDEANAVNVTLGRQGTASLAYLDGIICEVIIYDSALADVDLALVESYLKNKHGI